MSTRCNIIIKCGYSNRRVYLYHHHDGNPSGVGSDLKKVFDKYKDWQIKQHGYIEIPNKLVKNQFGLNDDGYEISLGLHGDIDYLYVINCKTRSLRCYAVRDSVENYEVNWKKVLTRENLREIPE